MELIDNINSLLGESLKDTLKPGAKLKIAASCFSIYAYVALKRELESIDSLEFIFTSPTFVPNEATDKLKKEQREFHIPKAERERSLTGSEFEIQLKNKLTQKAIARECADWIRRKATFRSNRGHAPMQPFIGVRAPSSESVYMPVQGFTAVDLGYQKGNALSNIVTRFDEPAHTGMFLNLFEQIWNDQEKLEDVTARLCDHIASVYQENAPERIYFLMLYNIFREFLEDVSEDVLPNDRTGYQDTVIWNKLFNFQRDAATGLINKLETYSGCILADSVGLGKTFTALAVIKYYELRNKSVLVLCPKKLADNWLTYNQNLKTNILAKDRFAYDVLCHTDLSRSRGTSLGMPLDRVNWGNYDLVVIDESHNFRNNDLYKDKETRYQRLMNQVIRQGVKTKVLMLSATPVNNRFSDLRNQLALAYEGDSNNLNDKLRTEKDIDSIFRRAQAAFNAWANLPPEKRTAAAILNSLDFDFFELLDSVTIARSRRHIETFYNTADIGRFPERRKPMSFHCPLTQRDDVIGFNEIFNHLSLLKLAVYAPVSYILPSRLKKYEEQYDTQVEGGRGKLKQVDREKSLQALMTTNLLKRLESSVEAFRLTLQSLQASHRSALDKIAQFNKTGQATGFADVSEAFEEADFDEDNWPMPGDISIGKKIQISLEDMDLPSWEQDLQADLLFIDELLGEMSKVTPADDAKLQHLKTQIASKISSPINPGNKKVLIFTAFADTANYLYDNLADYLQRSYQVHTGKVTGSDGPKSTLGNIPGSRQSYDFQGLLTLFSPRSKEKAAIYPDEPREIDILIGTDCISEGQNLQDCDYLINYDIHWNPVRIIQRFGRVDRIGSQNSSIQLVNYWPDISLDEYINLKERVENRMMIADVTATGDDNVLNAQANDVAYRKEQLRRLQDEVIEMEDLKTGVSITDLGLNDFRMDLLNYIKQHGELSHLPNGLHAVVPAQPELGLLPGVIFTLRNRNHGVDINQQNRLYPHYLIYIDNQGQVISDYSEAKRLLDLARIACKGECQPIREAYQRFNQVTDDGRNMQAHSNLLDQAIHSMIEVKAEKDIDSLFSGGKTTALVDTIAGLDDFELITFIVIQDVA
ncbi:helicase-related protein [Pseudomonas aeruginosa]|uniref:helicase-related protein n=5 Tax=Pseudomonas aeruginosa TaxID=287 RepID=UPI00053F03C4|nr:helicase-related protein [Pseudomonas aeruginosa]RRU99909.1 ATP-dependent helicase [Stutzerimonas xanthomarina]SCZ05934.1 ATP-dependent helicase HepA [Acinetobacter baumannii]ASJ84600.1 ATP-dependent helicase HEPA [Pseudomonas aeruginosa]AVK25758.1 DEAD/DEAH box helicase family protein [Pseudomonas aeruginosa]AWE80999.1 DEAD/DEAH box helicase family protein [Pseudomonas aeruginosa]